MARPQVRFHAISLANVPRKLVLSTLLIFVASFACASDIYLAQNAQGANTGADCADAHAYTFFNSSANWGSGGGQIGPGTTVHLCGTINGSAGSNGLTFQGSGASGNPVILKFEQGAVLQAPEWGPNSNGALAGAIVISGQSHIVIDGGGTGNPGKQTFSPNGVIQNTLNGTIGGACPGGSCTTNYSSNGIAFQNVTDLTIQNLVIKNIYVRTSLSDENGTGIGILKLGTANQLVITNNVLNNSSSGMWYELTSGTNDSLTVTNNEFTNMSAGLGIGQGSGNTGVVSSVTFAGNHLHNFNTWNETSSYNYHHDGIHIYSYSVALTNINVYGNLFDGDLGSGTAWVYYEQYSSGTGAMNVFNNVFNSYATQSGNGAGGARAIEIEGGNLTTKIYNNTIIGVSHTGSIFSGPYNNGSPAANMDLRNNTISGQLESLIEGSGVNTSSNNNTYDFSNGNFINIGSLPNNLSAWQSQCHCDSASKSGVPDLGSSYVPASGSMLIGAAQDLSSMGMTTLDKDFNGLVRPSTGTWDIGACLASASAGAAPAPPTSLTALVN